MKNSWIYLIIIFAFAGFQSKAQTKSSVTPVNVYWLADGKKYDIQNVRSGIKIPNRLELVVELNPDTKLQGQKFEFKWYHRGPTRDYLTNSFIKKVDIKAGMNKVVLKAGRGSIKSGWWKVQVYAYVDRKPLAFQGKNVFWIKIL